MMRMPAAPKIKYGVLDRMISAINPRMGMERIRNKAAVAFALDGLGIGGYVVPGNPKRSMRGWLASANHTDRDIIPILEGSRAGARDLFMNTPVAAGLLRRVRTNVVGWGLLLQSRIDRQFLKMSDKDADAWERNTEREFKSWANSPDCDIRRTLNFNSLQGLALFSTLLSGDCFVLLPYKKRKNDVYDLKVHLIEADFVSNPYHRMEVSTFSGGVETDEFGAPIAYHIRHIPPGFPILAQSTGLLAWMGTWERVLAFGAQSGRRNVLHLMHVERPGQRRGVTFLAPVIERLKNLSRLSESELTAAVVASFFTVFIKSEFPGGGTLGDSYIPEEKVTNPSLYKADKNNYEMGPGSIVELANGESIDLAKADRPNAAFTPFFEAIVREIGSATEIPSEQIMLTFQASYSAARAAILEAWKFYRVQRSWLSSYFCQPVYEAWLTNAINIGRISAPGFNDDPVMRNAWAGSKWTGPGQGQINPENETKAALQRIGGLLSTYEEEHSTIFGNDWEPSAQRLAREQSLIKDLNLVPEALMPTETIQGAAKGTDQSKNDTPTKPPEDKGDKEIN